MSTRLKAIAPLVVSIGVLAFVATWIALNFTFHWVTVQDGVFGKYGLPQNIHLALPAIFVGWGIYFLLGADAAALGKTVTAALTGSIGAALAMWIGPMLADSPDFWGLGVMIGLTAAGLVVLSTVVEDDRFAPAPAFCCYASVFFWWIATGLDNFVPDGKGPHTAEAVSRRSRTSRSLPEPARSAACSRCRGSGSRSASSRRWSSARSSAWPRSSSPASSAGSARASRANRRWPPPRSQTTSGRPRQAAGQHSI